MKYLCRGIQAPPGCRIQLYFISEGHKDRFIVGNAPHRNDSSTIAVANGMQLLQAYCHTRWCPSDPIRTN